MSFKEFINCLMPLRNADHFKRREPRKNSYINDFVKQSFGEVLQLAIELEVTIEILM